MSITIALAGNPNCGKTTLFNELTGSSQYVGNWPGVTVEKKEGKLKGKKDIAIMDLPGIYSLSPYTLEEVVTRNYLIQEQPDVIVNLLDATNLERNLYLTTQLMEVGIPVVIGLNMMDLVKKSGDQIDIAKLSKELGCPVFPISAAKAEGLQALMDAAIELAGAPASVHQECFSHDVEHLLEEFGTMLPTSVPDSQRRWYEIKLLERDEKATENLNLSEQSKEKIEQMIASLEEKEDDDSESIITSQRYDYLGKIVEHTLKRSRVGMTISDKIDQIVTNRLLALPIFAVIMFIVYFVSVSWLGTIVTDWTNDVLFGEIIAPGVEGFLINIGASAPIQSLIVDGIIGGVGAVLGFVPQMIILFFFLSVLEDCGYMARIAFIMDRIFRRFGLSGKSFIPMLIGSGCSVPGIMASRTIENDRDRRMTIMVTSFIPCGAKVPIITLIATGTVLRNTFAGGVWVAPLMYFLGVFTIIVSGIILKKTKIFAGDPAPFVMELPQYHIPAAKGVLLHMWERVRSFVVKAGTVIFVASALIWFLSYFSLSGGLTYVGEEGMGESILAVIGRTIAPIFAPLGFGNWQATVATFTGLIAKEQVLATFGILFGLGADVEAESTALHPVMDQIFTTGVAAMSFLVFNLLCAPCFAAIGAIRREMASGKWTIFAVAYQCILAYIFAFIVYQLGSVLLGYAAFGVGTVIALLFVVGIIYLLFRSNPSEKALKKAIQSREK